MAHNSYQIRGGEDESCMSEVRMLQAAGHEVVLLTEHNNRIREMNRLAVATGTLWSRESHRKVRDAIRAFRPDVLHVQNFFPLLSPSVYYAAHAEGVATVQSLRNYRLLCPNGLFFRDGKVCESCMGHPVPWQGVANRCYRGSALGSAVVAGMAAFHRGLSTWTKRVDMYIALTNFARNKFIEGGLPEERIVVKPNFVYPDPGVGDHEEGFVLYVGRLSPEKGLGTLLKAWSRLGGNWQLKIVGDGPMEDEVRRIQAENPTVQWLGRREISEVHSLMGQASLLVFPSEWYETFGRVAIEAYAKGTPVIASNCGAIAEVVRDGKTGLLFAPGDETALLERLRYLLDRPSLLREMGQAARAVYDSEYTVEQNVKALEDIYACARLRLGARGAQGYER